MTPAICFLRNSASVNFSIAGDTASISDKVPFLGDIVLSPSDIDPDPDSAC